MTPHETMCTPYKWELRRRSNIDKRWWDIRSPVRRSVVAQRRKNAFALPVHSRKMTTSEIAM
ncbi:MAG TPA: hypothetical protein VFE99_00770, partial [Agromyces sp.]|nr:hypothetical protein [Agromyces sp.]